MIINEDKVKMDIISSKKDISSIYAYELLDSRGNPTVCAEIHLNGGIAQRAIVPSGASVGAYEAHEKRDGESRRYGGKGVRYAVQSIEEKIAPALKGISVDDQELIDCKMIGLDGTSNKENFGANAILAVSLACARAAAAYYHMELYRYIGGALRLHLPIPMMNIINGGAHSKNNIDIQEFMIVPVNAENFAERVRMCAEIYHELGKILNELGYNVSVGDEGGFSPNLDEDREAIALICKAIDRCGYTGKVMIALDVAASEWCRNGVYHLPKRNRIVTREDLCAYYLKLCSDFPIMSIEDGMGEDDREGWKLMTDTLGDQIMLVGDDLFVTDFKRLQNGIQDGLANAVLLKPNQVGTLTETAAAFELARKNAYSTILSHRSGDTEDAFLADLAAGLGSDYIKSGAPCRSERVAKYNRLLVIENQMIWQR